MTEPQTDQAELMTKYGISKVPNHIYHYREFRYSNLKDALAQAKRDAAQSDCG